MQPQDERKVDPMRYTPRQIRRPKYSAAMIELQRVSLALVDAATAAALAEFAALANVSLQIAPQCDENTVTL